MWFVLNLSIKICNWQKNEWLNHTLRSGLCLIINGDNKNQNKEERKLHLLANGINRNSNETKLHSWVSNMIDNET